MADQNQQDGIFTEHGPDGIFGRGGPPANPDAPAIDSDGTNLRETMMVAYPSPGHMRVARATRNVKNGAVEFQEQYRTPTPEEVKLLAQKGVAVGPGSLIGEVPDVGDTGTKWPWGKLVIAVAVGAAGFWATNKFVVPMVTGPKRNSRRRRVEEDDEDSDVDDG